jgi:peptidoglycan/LPS O-acetylase OafA/YrhL
LNIAGILKQNIAGKLLNHLAVFVINILMVRMAGASWSGVYFNEIYLLNFIAIQAIIVTSILTKRPLIFLGEISYGIYVLQYPIFIKGNKLGKWIGFNAAPQFFYFNLLLLIGVASLSYLYFEKPMRKYLLKFIKA